MRTWTAENRLTMLAVLLHRKRSEAMGTAPPSTINHETMLIFAVAPADICEKIAGDLEAYKPTTRGSEAAIGASLTALTCMEAEPGEPIRTEIWLAVVKDIRRMFHGSQWPSWLPKIGGQDE